VGSEVGVFGPQIQLLSDIVPVGDHRADGEAEELGNLFGAFPLLDQLGDLNLFRCQMIIGGGSLLSGITGS
jgi:hypothetical protein